MKYTGSILLALILVVVSIGPGQSHNCNSLVVKETEGLLNYLANVTVTIPKDVEGDWSLDMDTDVPFTFIGGWGVWLRSDAEAGKVSFRSRLENNTLSAGDQVSFRFRIQYSKGEPRPEVISLKWEGETQLCAVTDDSLEEIKARRRRTSSRVIPRRKVNYRKRYFINL